MADTLSFIHCLLNTYVNSVIWLSSFEVFINLNKNRYHTKYVGICIKLKGNYF